MSSLVTGIVILVMLLVLLATGMPIAFALGLVSLISILLFLDSSQITLFGQFVYDSLNDFAILAIPLFIFMGAIFGGSKASSDLFEAAQAWLSKVRGGLAMSSVVAAALFAALTGASAATAAAIGKVAIPQMKKRGYSNVVSTGAVAAGGTLGILIPPSITLILYGIVTEQSIGQLFFAGVIPGIFITGFFCVWIAMAITIEKRVGSFGQSEEEMPDTVVEEDYSWKFRFASLLKVIPFVLLIVGILGALYLGVATPSEGAALGALFAFLMVVIGYRSMTWKKFSNMLLETTSTSTMVLMIIAFSAVFGTILSFLRIPQDVALLISDLDINRWWIMLLINVILLFMGFFLPPVSIILMVTPILFPIITTLEFDPIWFGIIMTINMEMGLITPPVGLNLYVIKGIAPEIPLRDILIGSLPYVAVMALGIVFFSFFPGLVTWLPNRLFS